MKKVTLIVKNILINLKFLGFCFLRLLYENQGIISGHRFFCSVFSDPERISNLHINCDGFITCNCHDSLGLGKLGNVLASKERSFFSIWNGEKANRLKDAFLKNKIPLIICPTCPSFKTVQRKNVASSNVCADKYLPKIHDLNIENTVLCNYDCLGCNRKSICSCREKNSLSLSDFQTIFSAFERLDIESIGLHNLGEPSLHKEFSEQLKLAREKKPKSTIFFSTNGSFINNDKIRDAIVRCVDYIEFSIDGTSQEIAERYQLGIDFKQVIENLKNLIAFRNASGNKRLQIYWKYVLFWWNDQSDQIEELINMAKEINVDGICFSKARSPAFCNPFHWIWNEKKYVEKFKLVVKPWGDLVLKLE